MKRIPIALELDVSTQKLRWAFPWLAELGVCAYRKFDGHCCMVAGGRLYKRRKLARGEEEPEGWIQTEGSYGWIPFEVPDKPEWDGVRGTLCFQHFQGKTCELVGPGIRGNPEGKLTLKLVLHTEQPLRDCPKDPNKVAKWLQSKPYEGVVWHHPDGRMAKLTHQTLGRYRPSPIEVLK